MKFKYKTCFVWKENKRIRLFSRKFKQIKKFFRISCLKSVCSRFSNFQIHFKKRLFLKRKLWLSRVCHRNTVLFFAFLDAIKKLKLIFAKFRELWHCVLAFLIQGFFSPSSMRRKKSKFVFAKFREWSTLRICDFDTGDRARRLNTDPP